MTNEEAITMLKRMQEPEAWEPQITEEVFNALDMAITALRNEQKAEESLLKSDPDSVSNEDVVYRQLATILCSRIKRLSSSTEPKTSDSGSIDSEKPEIKTDRTTDDTISRQAAIDATWFEPSYTDPLNVLTEARDRIKAMPSAQPELHRGEGS